jgi:AcrR family transcriptional regulator
VAIKNDRILDAAAVVLVERPNATLQTIANAAGISRTTIFNRYATREDLLEALGVHALQRIGAVTQRLPLGDPGDVATVLLDATGGLMPLGPHSAFLRSVPGQGNNLESHWAESVTPLGLYFAAAQSRGRLRSDLSIRWLVSSYMSLLFGAWDEIAVGELGPAQAARLVVDTWLSGSAR